MLSNTFNDKSSDKRLGIQRPIFKKTSTKREEKKRKSFMGAMGSAFYNASAVFFKDIFQYFQDAYKDEQGNVQLHQLVNENSYELVYESRKDAFSLNHQGVSPFAMMLRKAFIQCDSPYFAIISQILRESSAQDLNQQFGARLKFEIGIEDKSEISGELKDTILHALAKWTIEADLSFAQQVALRALLDVLIKKGANTAQLNADKMTASDLISANEKYHSLSNWFTTDVLDTDIIFVEQGINRLNNLYYALDLIDMVLNPSGGPTIVSDLLNHLEPLIRKLINTDQATFLKTVDLLVEYRQNSAQYLIANRDLVAELTHIFDSEIKSPTFSDSEPLVEEIIEGDEVQQPAAVIFSNLNEINDDFDDVKEEIESSERKSMHLH
ncbi:MAG: hypothetical protein U1E78_09530 [Gammaproteobacteria bacterium]